MDRFIHGGIFPGKMGRIFQLICWASQEMLVENDTLCHIFRLILAFGVLARFKNKDIFVLGDSWAVSNVISFIILVA